MRVFVTGSTGFVGTAVVRELLSGGHQVLGLSRSGKNSERLTSLGADVLEGTIETLDTLRKGASECDAVVHLAFVHNFADFEGSCAIDRAAITAMGSVLAAKVASGRDCALVITSGVVTPNGGDEDDVADENNHMSALRGASEPVCLEFAKQGVRASVVRLPPTTHGPGESGFMGPLITIALEKGISAYVGGGQNRWCAGYRDDAAKLYRLAIEKANPGSTFHAIAEEGVPVKDIAVAVGKHLNMPVASIPPEKVEEHFGWFQFGPVIDKPTSSRKTRERLGWEPTGKTLIEDIPIISDYIKSSKA